MIKVLLNKKKFPILFLDAEIFRVLDINSNNGILIFTLAILNSYILDISIDIFKNLQSSH